MADKRQVVHRILPAPVVSIKHRFVEDARNPQDTMAYTRGRCTNVDYCSLAIAKRDIEVKIGADFVCPECARPLRPPPVQAGSGRSGLVAAGLAGVAVLVGGGLYAGYRLSGPSAPPRIAAGPRLAAAAPAPAPAPVSPSGPASASAPPAAAPPPPKPEPALLLRLEGPVQTAPLMSRLAAAYLGSLGDSDLAPTPGARPGESLVTGLRVGRLEAIATMTGRGRTGAPADLALDVSTASPAAGTQTVALSPAYVVVNARNPVTALSEAQLRGVLDGSIARWTMLGGTGGTIHLVQSADPAAADLAALVPGTPPPPAAAPRVADAAAHVAADPDALALMPAGPAPGTRALAVASLGARPALPTPAAVANGLYPLVRRVTLSLPAGGHNPFATRFLAWALSPEGQDAVAQAGLVPLHVAAEAAAAPPAPATPKDRYRTLVTGATRLAADLHFEPSSNKLDLHSAREVDRVWNFMMSDHTPPDHLIMMGFADNQGTPEANLALSQQRAQAVAQVFAHRGLPPGQVVAFGSDLPVADNASEAGREKNRRVEVFLRN